MTIKISICTSVKIFNNNLCLLILPLLFVLTGFNSLLQAQDRNYEDVIIMGVYAHPDDETSSGPVFAKYARKGAQIILVVATDGRLGVTDLTDLEAGDELAKLRREEMQCAADVLGADLHHMRYHDQLRAPEGQDLFIQESRKIIDELHEIMGEWQPDIIITWGPDGGSNHLDHRIISATVTQVVLNKDWEKRPSLFYSDTQIPDLGELWRYRGVHEDFLTVRESFSEEDVDVAAEAARCHSSQFLPDLIDSWAEQWRDRGHFYFRPFEAPRARADDLLSYPSQYE